MSLESKNKKRLNQHYSFHKILSGKNLKHTVGKLAYVVSSGGNAEFIS